MKLKNVLVCSLETLLLKTAVLTLISILIFRHLIGKPEIQGPWYVYPEFALSMQGGHFTSMVLDCLMNFLVISERTQGQKLSRIS